MNRAGRTARDYAENLVCCCPSCIAVQPWRADLRARRVKAARNAVDNADGRERAERSRVRAKARTTSTRKCRFCDQAGHSARTCGTQRG